MIIKEQYYLSQGDNIQKAVYDCEMSAEEIEDIVGRFDEYHHRAGQLRGQVWVYRDVISDLIKKVQIRHHFKKSQILWRYESND